MHAENILQRIRNELNNISVQSTIRGVNRIIDNKKIYDINNLVRDAEAWDKIRLSIGAASAGEKPELALVAKTLYNLAEMVVREKPIKLCGDKGYGCVEVIVFAGLRAICGGFLAN